MSSTEDKELLQQITFLSRLINQHKNANGKSRPAKMSGVQQQRSKMYQLIRSKPVGNSISAGNTLLPSSSSRVFVKPSAASHIIPKHHPSNIPVQTKGDKPHITSFSTSNAIKPKTILINPNFKKILKPEINSNAKNNLSSIDRSHNETKSINISSTVDISTSPDPSPRPTTILVNPNFKGTMRPPSIHINSKVFNKKEAELKVQQKPLDHPTQSNVNISAKQSPGNKYTIKTNRKLVRQKSKESPTYLKSTLLPTQKQNPLVCVNKRKLVRLSPKSTKLIQSRKLNLQVRNPYQYNKDQLFKSPTVIRNRKYLVKRLKLKSPKKIQQTSTYKFVKNSKTKSTKSSTGVSKFKLDNRKPTAQFSTKSPRKATSPFDAKKKYSWRRSSVPQGLLPNKIYRYRKYSTSSQGNKSSKFSIQGQKFIMDPQGKTLKRIPADQEKCRSSTLAVALKRIHVAGATYKAKAPNIYVRTNDHTLRNIVSQAKQKSISVLVNKLKKNNQPCIFYRRFGKCIRKEKGTCPCVHDPKQIAICKKFLRGQCEVTNCPLSHDVRPEKMPTCQYFLDGCCTRDPCPYLHVKVNARADICHDFLAGYCTIGSLCKKRHVNICPEFDRSGTCSKGKSCPYPHKDSKKKTQAATSSKSRILIPTEVCAGKDHTPVNEAVESTRYYQSDDAIGSLPLNLPPTASELSLSETPIYVPSKKRPKIGTLPSFIPL